MGNEVATLVNAEKPAGSYEVEFDASLMASGLTCGVYFYRIVTDKFTQTRKMLLVK